MKTLKQSLWFIVPILAINLIIYKLTFVDKTNLPKFAGNQFYLKMLITEDVFKRALVNTFALPLIIALCIGVILFLAKWIFKRQIQRRIRNA